MENNIHPHSELTHQIIGAAMEVHNVLKFGFREVYYQKSPGLGVQSQKHKLRKRSTREYIYRNELIGNRRVDFMVEKLITVEIKAVPEIENRHLAQAIHYVETL